VFKPSPDLVKITCLAEGCKKGYIVLCEPSQNPGFAVSLQLHRYAVLVSSATKTFGTKEEPL
jgi:hypothetical protein